MSVKRVSFLPAGALSLAAVVALLSGCAPAQRIPLSSTEVAAVRPTLTIKKDIDMIRLEGLLPSFEQVHRVYEQTASLFDRSMIINDIIIDAAVAKAEWLDPVLATVAGISHVDDFSVTATNGQMLVGGSVASSADARSIESMASSMAGLELAVTSNLLLPEAVSQPEAVPQKFTEIDLAALEENAPSEAASAVVVEQPAVAVVSPEVTEVAGAVRVVPESSMQADSVLLETASNDADVAERVPDAMASNAQLLDSDADGVPDADDQCPSRDGYPVGSDGCQLLDGYLENVRFTDQPAALAAGSERELNEIATAMQRFPNTRIAVVSYASGESDIQRAMARKRAFLVTSYLEGQGVDKGRLKTFALAHQPGAEDKIMIKEID
jgi:outer membrane protein OmpA-like peptidoglycan-associated protein